MHDATPDGVDGYDPVDASKQVKLVPTRISRTIESRAKLVLFIAVWRACDCLFASMIFKKAPTAMIATTVKILSDTMISMRVNPEL